MSTRLGPEASATLDRLAAAMLPGAGAMPAWQAPPDGRLDQLLGYRPDSVVDVARGLRFARDLGPGEAWGRLAAEDAAADAALRYLVLGAYYTRSDVKAVLGYPGQQSRPVDPEAELDFIAAGLLAPVIARGPIWRAAPE